jgi:hypothetical protein
VAEKFQGEGSDIVTDEALKFIRTQAAAKKPFLAVVWFGNPHTPHEALPADKAAYKDLPEAAQNYYGELTAIDRSVGRLRTALRELKVADNKRQRRSGRPEEHREPARRQRNALGRWCASAGYCRVARTHCQTFG